MGVLSTVLGAAQGSNKVPGGSNEKMPDYTGPYHYTPRTVNTPPPDRSPTDSSEFQWFSPEMPSVVDSQGNPAPGNPGYVRPANYDELVKQRGYATGGLVALKPGGFVMDARTVSELGNGSSTAGKELLARHGGRPIGGQGDGVSDSVKARIGADRPARVARDEVAFSPQAVSRMGGGDRRRGAQKLYGLMDKAKAARAVVPRGQDNGLKGLLNR
jgi:hypothetical protein